MKQPSHPDDIPAPLKKEISPFVLLVAPDFTRKQRIIQWISSKLNTLPVRFNASQFSKKTAAAIADELSSLSLFSKGTFVILSEIQQLKADQMDSVLKLPALAASGSCLLMTGEALPRSKKLQEFAKKNGVFIALPAWNKGRNVDLKEARDWIEKEFSRHGVSCDRNVAELLVQASGADLDQCATMITQSTLYADRQKVTADMITTLFGFPAEGDIFRVIDLLLSGKRGNAIILLQELLDRNENAFQLLAVIARTLTKLLELKMLLSKGVAAARAKQEIRVYQDSTFSRYVNLARSRSVGQLQAGLESVLRADARLKNKSLGSDLIIYDLVDSLITTRVQ